MTKVTAVYSLSLPLGLKLKVKKGDQVKADQTIASGEETGVLREYNLAQTLAIPPQKVHECLTKKLGEAVVANEVIAQKKGFLKRAGKKFLAPVPGTLASLTQEGILRLKMPGKKTEIKASFEGEITQAIGNKFSLSFPAMEIKGSWGVGGQQIAPLAVLPEIQKVGLFDLNNEAKGKIIAVWGGFTGGFWYKAISLEVGGLLSGQLNDENLKNEVKKENLPLVVLDEVRIEDEVWQVLKKNQGKNVLIEGQSKRLVIPQ